VQMREQAAVVRAGFHLSKAISERCVSLQSGLVPHHWTCRGDLWRRS
jgi:hypothetical protein